MDKQTMLASLKIDLGITTTAFDDKLQEYLTMAADAIAREGIDLDPTSLSDGTLQVMYAGWMWRKRDTGDGMPRMLRYQLNNRLFSQKISEGSE